MQVPCRSLIVLGAVAAALSCATTAGRASDVDRRAGPRRASTLRHGDDSFAVPVSINGKTDEFLIDTTDNLS
jgi:predicted aspartyl protease